MGMYVVWRPEIFSKNHESFRSIEDLRDKIKENRSEIENMKAQIRALAMATPKDITPADYTPVEYINGYMDELFEELDDLYFELADFQHINLDTLRTRQRETAFMEECVSLNCNVVIDNTNTTAEERKKYIDLFKTNDYRIVGMYFQSILKDCIARNKARGGKVPRVAIPYMQNRLVIPSYAEGFDELYFVKFDGNGDFVIENWIE